MKYIENKKYLYKQYNIELIYTGRIEGIWFNCDHCGREIKNPYSFCEGDPNNPISNYHFGSECVKKCVVKL
jgi:hypothetical protein